MPRNTSISTGFGIIGIGLASYALFQFSAGDVARGLIASSIGILVIFLGAKNKPLPSEQDEIEGNLTFTITSNAREARESQRFIIDDDDYSIGRREEQLLECKFHRPGETVKIQGHTIEGPCYTGKRNPHLYGEPAVIDSRLKISSEQVADALGYWPDYGELTCAQRGHYLSWLASGRGHSEELGYVFLYLYGLERYVYRDAAKEAEETRNETLQFIVKDVERLRSLFADNRSFEDYTNNLIDAIYVKFWATQLAKRKGIFPARSPIAASYAIIEQANNGADERLDADWALQWVLGFGGVSRTKAVRENYSVVRLLFRHVYEGVTKGGLKIPPCKRKAGTLYFSPSTQGLGEAASLEFPANWYSPLELKRPLGKLEEIFREVAPDVRKLSKAIASKDVLELLNAWPAGVPTKYSRQLTAIVEKFESAIEAEQEITLSWLLQLFKQPATDKLTITQMRKMASALETCGYVVVPDPSCTPISLKASDSIIAYRGARLPGMSPEGSRVATAVQLGSMLALADGEVHEHEVAIIMKIVNSHPNSHEREYLHRYVDWRLSQAPSTVGLKKGIDQLDTSQKYELSEMLITLARADGLLPKSEVRELEKLFGRLGLKDGRVSEMLHGAATNSPVGGKPKRLNQDSGKKPDVEIDYEALKAHAASTREVQNVLSRIFEEDAEVEEKVRAPSPDSIGSWHEGRLDISHDTLAAWLLTSDEWPMASVAEKCQELKLMPEGALTAINEAAFDALGDSLLEMGDPVEVYRDVLAEQ